MSPGQIAAAVAALSIVVGAITRRRWLKGERMLLALAAAVALGVYASGVLSALPDPEKAIEDLAAALGQWTYVLVGAMAFLETGAFVGLVAPGEFTVIIGGVIAGQGEIRVIPLLGLVWVCCFLGDSTSFFVGRRLGRGFMERHGWRVLITPERLRQVDGYFERHGGKTVLIGRFVGLVRAVAPFIAGSSGMRYRRFLPYSVLGTGLWAGTFTLLGYFFYQSFDRAAQIAGRATFAFGLAVGASVLVVWAVRRLRVPENRARMGAWFARQGDRPLLRPVAAVVRPVWRRALAPAWRLAAPRLRFVWHRLTPGGLGIELTTMFAIAAVGLNVFAGYAVELRDMPRVTTADREVMELARDARTDVGVDVAREVTNLGSLPVVIGLVALGALLLAVRRRPYELSALVIGFAILYASVHLAKSGVDRARPPGRLVETTNASYPSGHAAYASVYVALAVIAARVLRGIASRAAIVLASVAVAAAIGLTRIYLEAHYWSDVVGGWGLGLGVFAATGIVALIVGYVRNNDVQPDGRPPKEPAPASTEDRDTASDRA